MSLLPGQILPATSTLGKVNADGTVTTDKNWWLLFYNIAQNALGSPQPPQTVILGSSPFTFTAPSNGALSISGPMESASKAGIPSIVIVRDADSVPTGFLNGTFPVSKGDAVIITYFNSTAPTVQFLAG